MPLSEEELRLLEQMERALVEEDPKFASTLRGTTLRSIARRRAILAGLVFLVGIAVLMAGAVSQLIVVGVVGFVIMLLSATVALTALRKQRQQPTDPEPAQASDNVHPLRRSRPSRRPRVASGGSFMERLEQRWRRRREQG